MYFFENIYFFHKPSGSLILLCIKTCLKIVKKTLNLLQEKTINLLESFGQSIF